MLDLDPWPDTDDVEAVIEYPWVKMAGMIRSLFGMIHKRIFSRKGK